MSSPRKLERIRQDFLNALRRLKSGRPKNRELRLRARLGTLKINPHSVALEAGHSRTLIGEADCRLPDVRSAVLSCKTRRRKTTAPLSAPNAERTSAKTWEARYNHVLSLNVGLARKVASQLLVIEELTQDLARLRGVK